MLKAYDTSLSLENILKQSPLEAYLAKQYQEQCTLMADLAKTHLNKQDYSSAAKLLNGALAIAKEQSLSIEELITELKEIEPRFIKEQLKIEYKQTSEAYGINPKHKQHLEKLRAEVKERLKEFADLDSLPDEATVDKLQDLFKYITKEINLLLQNILQDCINLMQEELIAREKPPCDYALVGTGSLAREEMTPYSDLECFLLISDPENKKYFRQLSKLFELKIINLGETDLVKGQNLLPTGMLNPLPKGFSLDVHKNPNETEHELIGTPEALASYQRNYISEEGNHLSPSLINVILITGEVKLLQEYKQQIQKIHQTTTENGQTLAMERALGSLKDDIDRFEPKMDLDDAGRLFSVKDDFYRLPQTIIDALALYYQLEPSSTLERIDALCIKNLILPEAAKRLKCVLSTANLWRLRTYAHYNCQHEEIDILARLELSLTSNSVDSKQLLRGTTHEDDAILTESYSILIPLHECAKQFHIDNNQQNIFRNNKMYDKSYLTNGIIAIRLYQHRKALNYFEQYIQNSYTKLEISIGYNYQGLVHDVLGESKEAHQYFNLALEELPTQNNINYPTILNNLGLSNYSLGNIKKAEELFKQALDIDRNVHNGPPQGLVRDLSNLGKACQALGKITEANQYFNESLEIIRTIYGEDNPNFARTLVNLGEIQNTLEEFEKAKEFYNKALAIYSKIYSNIHPTVALLYNNLGLTDYNLSNYNQALNYFERAYAINTSIHGNAHINSATYLNNLGLARQSLGNDKEAEYYYKESLDMTSEILGEQHPYTVISIKNLGSLWLSSKRADKAIPYFKRALKITSISDGDMNSNLIQILNDLAMCYQILGSSEKAKKYYDRAYLLNNDGIVGENNQHINSIKTNNNQGLFDANFSNFEYAINKYEKALIISIKRYGREHPFTISLFNNLGFAWRNIGAYTKALEYHQQALAIYKNYYPFKLREIAQTYNGLGSVYYQLNDATQAKECFEKALKINRYIYSNEKKSSHPVLAECLINLGLSYQLKGETIAIKQSVKYFEEAQQIIEKIYHQQHPELARNFNGLGLLYIQVGDAQKAKEHFQKAYIINNYNYGEQNMRVATDHNNIATALYELKDFDNSIKESEQALRITEKICKFPNVNTAVSYLNLAKCFLDKNIKKALDYAQKALDIRIKCDAEKYQLCKMSNLPNQNPSDAKPWKIYLTEDGKYCVRNTIDNIVYQGEIHFLKKRINVSNNLNALLGDSKFKYTLFDTIAKTGHLQTHSDVGRILYILASCYFQDNNTKVALQNFQYALTVQKQYGENNPEVAMILYNIGNCYSCLEEFNLSLENHNKALNIRKKILGTQHVLTKDSIKTIEEIKEMQKNITLQASNINTKPVLQTIIPRVSQAEIIKVKQGLEKKQVLPQIINRWVGILNGTLPLPSKKGEKMLRKYLPNNCKVIANKVHNNPAQIQISNLPPSTEMNNPTTGIVNKSRNIGDIKKDLFLVYELDNYEKQVKYFYELGQHYATLDNYIYAIACYNFAYAVCIDERKIYQFDANEHVNDIEKSINTVGNDFIKLINSQCEDMSFTELAKTHKKELDLICTKTKKALESADLTIEEIYRNSSIEIKNFVRNIIENNCQIILPNSVDIDYAVICLGSLARDEATPYSDLEFAILIKEETAEAKEYFRNLTRLIFIMLLNLGKTTPKVINIEELNWIEDPSSPTLKGFAIDSQAQAGCKTPLGNIHLGLQTELSYELICTPKKMAELHNEQTYKNHRHLSTALGAVSLICGDATLVKKYCEETNKVMKKRIKYTTSYGKEVILPLAKHRALRLLSEIAAKFEPRMGKHDREGHIFDVKYDLYRLPQMVIGNLSLYFEVKENNVWQQIIALQEKGVFSAENAQHLKQVISEIMQLRLKTYTNNNGRNYPLKVLSNEESNQVDNMLGITEKVIVKFHYVLMPLYLSLNKFIKQKEVFNHVSLFNKSGYIKGLIYQKLLNYKKAEIYFKKSCLKEGYIGAGVSLALMFEQLDRNKEAEQYILKAMKTKNISITEYAYCSSILGLIRSKLDKNDKQYLDNVDLCKIGFELVDYYPDRIKLLHNLAITYDTYGKNDEKLVCDFKAYKLAKQYSEKEDSQRLSSLNNFALSCKESGFVESKDYFEKLLNLDSKIYGEAHINYANTLLNLGLVYMDLLGDYKNAMQHFEKSLTIIKQLNARTDAIMSTIYHNLGWCYFFSKDFIKAKECFKCEKSISMQLKNDTGYESYEISINGQDMVDAYAILPDEQKNKMTEAFKKMTELTKKLISIEKHLCTINEDDIIFLPKKIRSNHKCLADKHIYDKLYIKLKSLLSICGNYWGECLHINIHNKDKAHNLEWNLFETFFPAHHVMLVINFISCKDRDKFLGLFEGQNNFLLKTVDDMQYFYAEIIFKPEPLINEILQKLIINIKRTNASAVDIFNEKISENQNNVHFALEQNQTNLQNDAVQLFTGQTKEKIDLRQFNTWYSTDILTYLSHLLPSHPDMFRYVFTQETSSEEQSYYKQLIGLCNLSSALEKSICFIATESPLSANHFIFGIIANKKMLIINPVGLSQHTDFLNNIEIIERIKRLGKLDCILFSNVKLQHDISGHFSCGPICFELMQHISKLSLLTLLKFFDRLQKDASIDITELLSTSLLEVIKLQNTDYADKIISLRNSHLIQLENFSNDAIEQQNDILAACLGCPEKTLVFDLPAIDLSIEDYIYNPPYKLKNNKSYQELWLKQNYLEAIKQGNQQEVANLLIKQPLLLNSLSLQGYTPLMLAISKDKPEIVKLLLNNNPNLKAGLALYTDAEDFASFIGKNALAELIHNKKLRINSSEIKPANQSLRQHAPVMFDQVANTNKPQSSTPQANSQELDVPHDNSCLFWAAALGYLIPAISKDKPFQVRYIKVFGLEKIDNLDLIKNLLKQYNHLSPTLPIFNHSILNTLVKEQFRSRVIEYIADHKTEFKDYWINQNNPHELSFEDYLSRMHSPNSWGGDLEIKAISQLLGCNVEVNTASHQENFFYNSDDQIKLAHVNIENEEEIGNHYHFILEQKLDNIYQQSKLTQKQKFTLVQDKSFIKQIENKSDKHPSSTTLIEKYKADNLEHALRKSAVAGNLEDVKNALQLGTDINAQAFGTKRTALHWAIINNKEPVVNFLLGQVANIDLQDKQGKTAEEYAIEKELNLIPFMKNKLLKAYFAEQHHEQCIIMQKLAQVHLNNKDYSSAAKLLNGAIAIAKERSLDATQMITEIKKIEPRFIKEQLNTEYNQLEKKHGINPQHKQHLEKLRVEVKERLKAFADLDSLPDEATVNKIQELFKDITIDANKLLDEIIQDCISLMPSLPPCAYALIGTGSLAREEMTPYSDLECFLLISEDTPETKKYFRQLSQLFELKIINLGETDLVKGQNLLPIGMLNPVPKGFSLDVHKNPNETEHELIGTPETLASYQLPEKYVSESNNHLSPSLVNVILITGEDSLLQDYKKLVKKIHQTITPNDQTLAMERALLDLSNDSDRFKPKISVEDAGRLFAVKDDFYRLPQTIIAALVLYYQLDHISTLDSISSLCINNLLLNESGVRLKSVLSLANLWRLRTYTYYGRQKEIVDILCRLNITVTGKLAATDKTHQGITRNDENTLIKSYKTLLLLHKNACEFSASKGSEESFKKNDLYTHCCMAKGFIALRLNRFKEAIKFFKHELVQEHLLKEEKAKLFATIGIVYNILGKSKHAAKYFSRALNIYIESYGKKHPDVMMCYNNLGIAFTDLGEPQKAIDYYNKYLNTSVVVCGPEHHPDVEVSTVYNNIGNALMKLNRNKALVYYKQALDIRIKLYGFEHWLTAKSYNNLGCYWSALGNNKMALEYHIKSLNINNKIYGSEHPDIANNYNNLGIALRNLGETEKAIKYHKLALEICIGNYNFEHPSVAICYSGLGTISSTLGNDIEAIKYHKQALDIYIKIYGSEHPDLVVCYNDLGNSYSALSDNIKAIEHYNKALNISIQTYGEQHTDVAMCYNNIGSAWSALFDMQQAIKHHTQALDIFINICGIENSDVAVCYNNLGSDWENLGNSEKAIECYKKALKSSIEKHDYTIRYPFISGEYKNKRIGLKSVSTVKISKILELPESYTIGTAIDDNGCFFDSFAQILNIYFNTQEYTEKSLRSTCFNYLYNNKESTKLINLDKESSLCTLSYNEKIVSTGQEIDDASQCGRPSIEGVILCRQLNLDGFYVCEIDGISEDNELFYSLCKVTKQGVKNVDFIDYNVNKPCLIIISKDSHFVPVLSINQINNENTMLYTSDINKNQRIREGCTHLKVANTYKNLGNIYKKTGNTKKAIKHYEKVLNIVISIYDIEHLEVAYLCHDLGDSYKLLGDTKNAIEYFERSLNVTIKNYGIENLEVLKKCCFLGLYWESLNDVKLNNIKKAIEYYELALNINIKLQKNGVFGVNITNNYIILGLALAKVGNIEQAIKYYEIALNNSIKVDGPEHPNVVKAQNILVQALLLVAHSYLATNHLDQAIQQYEYIIKFEPKPEHAILYSTIYYELGCAYYGHGVKNNLLQDFSLADQYFRSSVSLNRNAANYYKCGELLYQLGISTKNKELFKQSIHWFIETINLGKDNSRLSDKLIKSIVPLVLHKYIKKEPAATIKPAMLAFYLLSKIYLLLEQEHDAQLTFKLFLEKVSQSPSQLENALLEDLKNFLIDSNICLDEYSTTNTTINLQTAELISSPSFLTNDTQPLLFSVPQQLIANLQGDNSAKIIDNKSSIFEKYKTNSLEFALMEAATAGDLEDVIVIIELGVDINTQANVSRRTALHFAVINKKEEVINLLLNHDAKIDIQDSEDKMAFDYVENQHDFENHAFSMK